MAMRNELRPCLWLVVIAVVGSSLIGLSITSGARAAGKSPHCPSPGELESTSKASALRYALAELSDGFVVRAARHPRPGDLGWVEPGLPGGGFKTCGRRVDQLTWYFDLHPPGMECHACDSHLYVVKYRDGNYATLEFSG
jgi:hypothetical protein